MASNLTELAVRLNLAAREKWQLAPEDPLPPLILMTDEDRLPDPTPAMEALPRGSAVIYRHYDIADRQGLGQKLRETAGRRGLLFLVAGDRTLAQTLNADGIHMPEALAFRLQEEGAKPFEPASGKRAFNTVAAHSHEALERAGKTGASAALLSPLFATRSHPGAETLGARLANQWAASAPLPTYALGGVTDETAKALEVGGFAGIAAISALL